MSCDTERALSPDALIREGPRRLETLLRAIVSDLSAPILIVNDEWICTEASIGGCRLLGRLRAEILGRAVHEFLSHESRGVLAEETTESGVVARPTLLLELSDGSKLSTEFTIRRNVLPGRHMIIFHDHADGVAGSMEDFGLFLLRANGTVADWFEGAERLYGRERATMVGMEIGKLAPTDRDERSDGKQALNRTLTDGHSGSERWQLRGDGSQFWANIVTQALLNERGELQGFAGVVRDFSRNHERDEKVRKSNARTRAVHLERAVAGMIVEELDKGPEANDAFLAMVGYSREDVEAGRLRWTDLTPVEFAPLDDLAHEECLLYGACTPYEKELVHRDGSRVRVMIIRALLHYFPFQWITLVQDLKERDAVEGTEAVSEDGVRNFEEIVGSSIALRRILRQVEVVAPTDANVLILGETGTGKELIASAIHRLSPRAKMPFVTLNCAAIPTGLLESELFGYEKGAFTGALGQKLGRFEMANHGTLFLDEVGDIPLELQPKLLRALQQKSFERLGGTKTIPIDVRLVAATNRNLAEMMGDKLFRADLYYRLNVFPITVPPLRDRREDIPALVRYFTRKYSLEMNRQIEEIPAEAMRAMVIYAWPGNVRELENFVERAVILSQGSQLRAPLEELKPTGGKAAGGTLEEVERDYILQVLREKGGVVSKTAVSLGMPRTTLNAMMRKLGITRKDI